MTISNDLPSPATAKEFANKIIQYISEEIGRAGDRPSRENNRKAKLMDELKEVLEFFDADLLAR